RSTSRRSAESATASAKARTRRERRPGGLQPPGRLLRGHVALAEPAFEEFAKTRVVLQELVDQIFVLRQRDELKSGHSVDGHDNRLLLAKAPVMAQPRLRLTQRNHFHGGG